MNQERNELKAGLFIIASLIGIGAVLVGIKGSVHQAEPATQRQVSFRLTDDLSGLRTGDDVRLGGFKVGVVQTIRVATSDTPDTEPRIVVGFSLPTRYKLHGDSVITVQATLTGVPSLNIERIGKGAEVAEVTGEPGTFSTLATALRGVSPDLQGIVHDVRTVTVPKVNNAVDATTTLVRHVDNKIDPVVQKYDVVTDKAGRAVDEVGSLFGDTKPDLRGTMANLNKATADIRDRLPGILERVRNGLDKVQGTLDNARSALEDIKTTVANTKDITGSARSLIVGNRGRFERIISSLKSTSDNLKGASIEIRRSPWRLLYKPSADEMANLNLYDSAREFAEGAENLTDAATALRDTLKDRAADPSQVEKLVKQLDESFASFHQVENKLWVSVKE